MTGGNSDGGVLLAFTSDKGRTTYYSLTSFRTISVSSALSLADLSTAIALILRMEIQFMSYDLLFQL